MHTPLLRRLSGLALLLLTLLTLGTQRANATHLLGGELSYRYLDANGTGTVTILNAATGQFETVPTPFRYQVTLGIYLNNDTDRFPCNPGSTTQPIGCNPNFSNVPTGRPQVAIGFYLKDGTRIGVYNFNKTTGGLATPRPPNCPGVTPPSPVWLATYTDVVELPLTFDGYYAFWSDAARNNGIANIVPQGGGGGTGNMTIFSDMAPPTKPNSSPTFADTAVAVICRGDTTLIINNAVDADGDRLTYSLGTPFAGNYGQPPNTFVPNPPTIVYPAGFSAGQPFGPAAGNLSTVNANTGLSRYSVQNTGSYVVAVDVNEYRTTNGIEELVGRTRRDIQLVVRNCPAGGSPALPALGTLPRNYSIEEGQPLTFPIQVTTNPNNIDVRVRVSSALLDGPGGRYDATYNGNPGTAGGTTGSVSVTGTGAAGGNFQLNSRCGDARSTPYDILVTATNQDCKRKTVADVFQVTVTKTPPPTAIAGDNVICNPGVTRTYTAQGPTPPQGYRWRVSGGTITAGQGTASVSVQWASTAGARFVSLKNVSRFGCLSDSVSRAIDVRPVGTLTATAASPILCRGLSTTLSVTSATAGLTYTWTASTGGNFTGATITVSPTATTVYTVTGTTADGVCNTQASTTVTVTSPPVANAGASRSICAGATTVLGTLGVTGVTYAWTPATGLSSATVAQPTFSGTATTTFTLTATSSPGCFSTSSVTVTVNPAPTPDAGPNRAVCTNEPTQLGTPGVAGTTYRWRPTTGLNDPNVAQPTLTLATPGVFRYLVTASLPNASGVPCTADDSVFVTINARPVLLTIAPLALCAGGTVTLAGDISQPIGLTYQWTPTTGLASPTSAVSTLTLSTPGIFTYTLVATNTATGCTSSTTTNVTVNPLPTASAGPAQTLCANTATVGAATNVGTVVFTASPAAGVSFSAPSGGTATASFPVLTVPATYVVTATVTNPATTCGSTATASITINPVPVANAGTNRAVCARNQTTLGDGQPAVPGYTYVWTANPASALAALSSFSSPNPVLTAPQQGSTPFVLTYTLTVTNAQSCFRSSTVVVTVNPAAVAVAGPARSVCSGVPTTLGTTTPVAGQTYAWTPTTGLSNPTAFNPTLTLTNTTGANQVVRYLLTASTALGCTDTASVAVTLNPAAVATPGPALTFCSGDSRTLGFGAVPVPGATYAWTPTTGLSNPSSPTPTVTGTNTSPNPVSTTYTLNVTNPASLGSCTATGTVVVTINPRGRAALPTPAFTVCARQPQAIGRAADANTIYQWTATPASALAGLSSTTAANPTATLSNNGTVPFTVTYQLKATSRFPGAACADSATVTLTVNPKGRPTTGPALTFCSGETRPLGAVPAASTTYLWTATSPTALAGLSSATAANPTVTLANATAAAITYTYTLTATSTFAGASCDSVATVRVTVNPRGVANAGPATRTTCSGQALTLGAPGQANTTYLWTPATGLNSATAASPTLTLNNNGTAPRTVRYQVRATSTFPGALCADSASVTVTINPKGRPTTGPDLAFCSGETRPLGAPAGASTTYLWTASSPTALAGLSSATAANPTVTLANATTAPISYTYTLTATSTFAGASCDSVATVRVTVNPRGVANAGPANPVTCSRQGLPLGAPAQANTLYSWTPATGLSNPNIANPTLTLTNNSLAPITATYKVRATSTFPGALCADSASITVTINPKGRPTTGPDLAFCSGATGQQLGAVGTASTTYLWTASAPAALAGLSSATAANPTLTLTNTTGAPITYTYTLTATSIFAGASCDSAATVRVTVNPAAVAQAAPPTGAPVICSGKTAQLGNGPGVATSTYAWTPTNGLNNAAIANPTVTLTNTTAAPIARYYVLRVSTNNGCTAIDSVLVTVNPGAVAQAGTDATFCSGKSAQLGGNGPAIAGSTYVWTPATGLSSGAIFNPTVTLTNLTPAPITTRYRLVVRTALGCVDSSFVNITVNPAAIAQAGTNATFCSGKTAQLGGNGPAVAGATYAWTPTTGLSNAAIFNPSVTLANLTPAPITTRYRLVVRTALGCVDSSFVNITVNPAAIAQAGTNATFCSGKTAQLGGNGPAVAGATYAWTPTTGLSNAAIFNPSVTLANLTPAPITTRYRLVVTTALGCVDSSFVNITVNPAAIAQAGTDATFCSGGTARLGGAGPAVAGATYAWTPATGLSNAAIFNPTVTLTNAAITPITTRYRLVVTTALGCVDSSFVNITVNPAPIVEAGRDTTLCALKRTTLGTPAQPGYGYRWTPATGLSSAQVAQPVLTAANLTNAPITTTYRLTVTTPQGCPGRDSVRVTVNPRPAADSIVGPASVCPTVTGIAYSIRTPRATAYQWLVTGAVAFTGQGTPAIAVDWGPAGTGSVKAYTLNALGCSSDTVTLPILINTRLQTATPTGPGNVRAVAPLPRSVCQADGPYTYSTVFANGSLYSWTILGGTQVSTNLSSVTVQWDPVAVPTIGKIVVTETSNPASGVRCLGSSDTLRVLINPSPVGTLAITGPAAVCQGSGPATFGLPGGFAGSTYTFTLGGAALPGTANTATLATLPAPGSYVVTARETSAAGCAGPTFTFNFVVNPTPVAPVIDGSGFVCDIAQRQDYSVPATPGTTYAWTVTGGSVTAGQGTAQITVQFAAGAAAYAVSVVPSSQFGCVGGSARKTVTFDNPSLTLALASVAQASNGSVVLTFSAPASGNTPNAIQVLRSVAGANNFAVVGTVPPNATTYTDAGVDAAANSYEYRLSLTNGCRTVLSSVVTQTIRLVAAATPGTGGRDQGRIALTWNPYVGFAVSEYQVLRSTDGGPETPVGPALPATATTATVPNGVSGSATGAGFGQTFRVVAVGPNGLRSNSNTASTRFENPIVTYNVITPNNDGLNDVLVIDNIGLYPGNEFTVFNRWGREVYRTTNYQNTWGGDANTAAGNYYFLLKTADGNSRKGWFEVVK